MSDHSLIAGLILLGLTWLAMRGMDDRKPPGRSRRS
jgi:hypothetical protein